jgi:hypothetical protein
MLSYARLKQTKLYIPPKAMKLSRELYCSITNRDMHLLSKEIKETIFKTMHMKISLNIASFDQQIKLQKEKIGALHVSRLIHN